MTLSRAFSAILILCCSLVLSAVSTPALALAADDPCDLTSQEQKAQEGIDLGYCAIRNALPKSTITNIDSLIATGLKYTAQAVGLLALVGLIITGIMYITAGGDADKQKKATANIGYVVTGLVVFMLLFWIPSVLSGFLTSLPDTDITPKGLYDTNGVRTVASDWPPPLTSAPWPTTINPATTNAKIKEKRALTVDKRASVTIQNNTISPKDLVVEEGTVVLFLNLDAVNQTLYRDPEKSTLGPDRLEVAKNGYQLEFFEGAGFYYYAIVDGRGTPTAEGKITVLSDDDKVVPSCESRPVASLDVQVDISFVGMSVIAANVASGGRVTWTNKDTKIHTVTRDAASTAEGPKPQIIQPGQSLSYGFTGDPRAITQFVYFDETDPKTRYAICVDPIVNEGQE